MSGIPRPPSCFGHLSTFRAILVFHAFHTNSDSMLDKRSKKSLGRGIGSIFKKKSTCGNMLMFMMFTRPNHVKAVFVHCEMASLAIVNSRGFVGRADVKAVHKLHAQVPQGRYSPGKGKAVRRLVIRGGGQISGYNFRLGVIYLKVGK